MIFNIKDTEVWKDIHGYEGLYIISNEGYIISLKKKGAKAGILKPHLYGGGYNYVRLCKDGKHKNFKGARLVAINFVPNPNNYNVVNHEDGNKINDFEGNLKWCDKAYDVNHAITTGLNRHKNKTSKYVGVSKSGNKWKAQISINHKTITLGRFHSEEVASTAYRNAKHNYLEKNH